MNMLIGIVIGLVVGVAIGVWVVNAALKQMGLDHIEDAWH